MDLLMTGVIGAEPEVISELKAISDSSPGMLLRSLYNTTTPTPTRLQQLLETPCIRSMAFREHKCKSEFDMCDQEVVDAVSEDSDDECDSRVTHDDDEYDDDDDGGKEDDDDDFEDDQWAEIHDRFDQLSSSVSALTSTVSSSMLALQIVGAVYTVGLLVTTFSIWKQCSAQVCYGV